MLSRKAGRLELELTCTWNSPYSGVVVNASTHGVEVVVVANTPAVSRFDGVSVMVAWLSTRLHVGYNRRLTF